MELLHNRYEIKKRLSDTSIFEVYLCRDTVSDINVSVYRIRRAFYEDTDFVKGLTQGVLDCKDLNHPNTLRFIDLDADSENDDIMFIYEYADGFSLKEIFARQAKLPLQKSIEIAVSVLQSLDNAHLMGICHGDLCDSDIFITQDGCVKVRGYGRKDGAVSSSLAREHLCAETVKYQSPEVLDGQGLYEQSDVYSVGVLLYRMLTGRVPFDGNTAVEIATKALTDTPISPRMINRELSASLSALILEAISREYNQRVGTASVFVSRLTDVLRSYKQGEYSVPREKVIIRHEEEERRKSVIPMFIVLFLVVCIMTSAVIVAVQGGKKAKVPNLTGMTEEDAVSKLEGLKLNYEKGEDAFSDDFVAGIVCDQIPQSGTRINKKDKVIFFLSKGHEKVKMPYLTGLKLEEAEEKLREDNLIAEVGEETSDSVPMGYVIRTIPEADTVIQNGAKVLIVVSKMTLPSADIPERSSFVREDYTNRDTENREDTEKISDRTRERRQKREEISDRETEPKREKREAPAERNAEPKKTEPKKTEPKRNTPKPEPKRDSSSSYSSSSDATVEL
ncbi:MAG: PASTA domain-containing protein [Armatimonadetes bacterium]|nr:PASTA domain-containing protein [Candidatus Hippobium faecium]